MSERPPESELEAALARLSRSFEARQENILRFEAEGYSIAVEFHSDQSRLVTLAGNGLVSRVEIRPDGRIHLIDQQSEGAGEHEKDHAMARRHLALVKKLLDEKKLDRHDSDDDGQYLLAI